MTLDKLYSIVKNAEFPIHNRTELIRLFGKNNIYFEGHVMSGEEVAVHISKYPIRNVSEFFKDFLEGEVESYSMEEASNLGKFEARVEQ